MYYARKLLLTAALVLFVNLILRAQNIPVIVQAESGTLGSEFTTLSQAGVDYVTVTTDGAGQNPASANRVVTYTVTFPGAGTYDLFAKVRVGPAAANDDSFFYANGFGSKSATTDTDWITANQLAGVGWSASSDLISGPGTAGTGVWKWIKLSAFDGGEAPISFTVAADALTQTFQIGARENGLDFDRFAFGRAGLYFTVANLDNGEAGSVTPPPPPIPPAPLPPVIVQAESGTLGSELSSLSQDGVQYITSTTTGGGGNPGTADRVASYSVTFPRSGVYDLYARVRVGAGSGNDDSFFYANGFGTKVPASDADWIVANNLANVGWSVSSDVITSAGGAGTGVWKWIKLSSYNGGENPISFTVPSGALTQTFQIGRREDGLDFDQFAFTQTGLFFTVANLDNAEAGSTFPPFPNTPIVAQAEFGAFGSEFIFNNAGGVLYITPVGTTGGQNPGSANRVSTYTLTFKDPGTYDLYARVRVGAGAATDDSFYYGNGFGTKSPTSDADWITANNLWNVGWSEANAIITGPGTAQTGVWKWIKLSAYDGGEPPVQFTVPEGSLTQTFQIGAREDGLDFDKFAFTKADLFFTPGNLDNQEPGSTTGPPTGLPIAQGLPKFLGNVHSPNQIAYFENYWNQVTPENAGKWGSAEPQRDVMNWGPLDEAYNFAKSHGFPFKLHVLVWGAQQPAWIESLPADQQLEEIREWFQAVANRYPDIDFIDVVNEPLHDPPAGAGNGNYINALGGAGASGWDWVINSFRMAREIFPDSVKLMINEYSITNNTTDAQRYVGIINLLKAENLIDLVGIQGHAFSTTVPAATTLSNLNLIANGTGLPIHISELDIDGPTDQVQLANYQRIFPVFWEHPSVTGITLWGWKPGHWRTQQGAYIALHNGTERPALVWLRNYVQNKKPVVNDDQSFNVSEAASAGTSVGMVQATDPDTPTTFQSWQITGGTGAALFAINAATGEITVSNNSFDYETTPSYSLLVRVGDGYILSETDTVTINVTNANDIAPVVTPATFSVSETPSMGQLVGTMTATDADDATQPGFTTFQQWTITGGSGGSVFAINAETGEVSVPDSAAFDFETTTFYTLKVTVSDGVNTSEEATVTINVTNENDNTPVVTEGQAFSVSEAADDGAVVGTVLATDADDTNQAGFTTFQQWKITGGSGAWFFEINEATGEITVRTSRWFDFERTTTYSLRVSVSDGATRSLNAVVTINITNENDNTPEVRRFQRFYIDEWVADGDVVGSLLATDRDDRNQPGFTTFQDWQITGGSGDRFFDVNAATGELIVTGSAWLNRDGGETYFLKVKVTDGMFISTAEYVTVYISRKVDICHKGQTIEVNRSSVQFHLKHGDSANACGGDATDTEPLAAITEDQDSSDDQYEIFPNPVTTSTQQIVVALGSNGLRVKKVELVEFYTSRVVEEYPVQDASTLTIPCVNLQRGLYVLRLLGDRPVTRLIIVE